MPQHISVNLRDVLAIHVIGAARFLGLMAELAGAEGYSIYIERRPHEIWLVHVPANELGQRLHAAYGASQADVQRHQRRAERIAAFAEDLATLRLRDPHDPATPHEIVGASREECVIALARLLEQYGYGEAAGWSFTPDGTTYVTLAEAPYRSNHYGLFRTDGKNFLDQPPRPWIKDLMAYGDAITAFAQAALGSGQHWA